MRFLPLLLLWVFAASAWAQTPAEFFEKKIRPILVNSCQTCHNAKIKTAGLDLSSAEGFIHGGQSGPIVVAGSLYLVGAIRERLVDDPRLRDPET